jgi:hypothetical protein
MFLSLSRLSFPHRPDMRPWRRLTQVLALAAALTATRAQDTATSGVQRAKAGPWGVIEYNYLYIEAPDELIANITVPNSTPRWVFPAAREAELRELFERAKLPTAMVTRMLQKPRKLEADGAITLFPSVAELEAMTPEMRSIVYARLATADQNEFYKDPVVFTGGDIEAWLRDVRIRPELKEKMRQMAYRRGDVPVFSDIPVLLSYAESDAEVRRILRLSTRVRTFVARLKVTPETDFNALYDYWSDQRRARSIRPFLESVAEKPSETSLDIVHLLPAFARRLLYTYPSLDLAASGRFPDCHWTSLNFFSRAPQAYYLDTRLATNHVIENYTPITEPYTFGDLLFFLDANGDAVHSCVYVADDIVFTKNGENMLTPWILMRLPNVRDLYSAVPGLKIQGYRRKPGSG